MNTDKNMRDEIARVAYGLYEKRGYSPGNDFSDWIEAENIVKKKYAKGVASDAKPARPTQPMKAAESARSKSRGQFSRPATR